MKSYFSKIFYPFLTILLLSLLFLGIALHMLVQGVLKDRCFRELETTAHSIGELAEAYIRDENFIDENFMINLSLSANVTDSNAVICDMGGTLIMCSDSPISCSHQGSRISQSYLDKVLAQGTVRNRGKLDGLYENSRYVVSSVLYDGNKQPDLREPAGKV